MADSPQMSNGEVTQLFPNIAIIQYLMPVAFVTELSQNTAGADVNPEISENG